MTGRKKRRIPLSVYLSYLLVATLLVTGVTFSGYITTATGGDEARVAVMAGEVRVDMGDTELLIGPGDSEKIKVTVSNQSGTRTCEVAQRYELSVQRVLGDDENLPVTYGFYKDEACSELCDGKGELNAGTAHEVEYWLKVEWPEEKNNPLYAWEIEALELHATAEQID